MTDETTTTKKAGLSPIEVGAGAGAAVIAAFASSYLGTAGTVTGAAVASVVGTVSTSVLRSSAQTSAHRLKQTTTRLRDTRVDHVRATDARPVESEDVDPYGTQLFRAADWIDPDGTRADPASSWETSTHHLAGLDSGRPGAPADAAAGVSSGPGIGAARPGTGPSGPGAPGGSGTGASRPAAPGGSGTGASRPAAPGGSGTGAARPAGAEPDGAGEAAGPVGSGLRRLRGRWVVMGAGAVAAFAVSLGVITGIEAAAGKPLSGLAGRESGGGTTVGRATGTDSGSGRGTPSPTPTPATSGGPTSTAPVPGTGPTVSPTAPSAAPASPAPSPTQQPPTQPPTQAPSQAPTQAPGPDQRTP